ncbi:MAG: hypothetical protein JWM34_1618 [Ilumatobacteraceae bacterium]|nr:hypothetical protein [Ilumatobacteraceae bacterium]
MTNENIDSASAEATTLTELLGAYARGGFTSDFSEAEDSTIECHTCQVKTPASDVG